MRSWERVGLAEPKKSYSFSDLASLKTLQSLRKSRIPAKKIREAIHQIRLRLTHGTRPLDELKIVCDGRRIAVQLAGERMEALTGQMLFDFDAKAPKSAAMLEFRQVGSEPPASEDSSEAWFRYALEMERSGAAPNEIIEAYRRVVAANPNAAGAWVNLGTLHYRQRLLPVAERCYREAVQAYPEYSLAYFNLGNVCEQMGRLDEASEHYESALRFQPDYADAHYNLALLEERRKRFLRAVEHWQAYLESDQSSPWADIARRKREHLRRFTSSSDQIACGSFRKPVRDAPE